MAFSINEEMPEIVRQYARYLRNINGRGAKTVNEYCLDLRTFFRFMKHYRGLDDGVAFEKIPVSDIDMEFIRSITKADIFEFMNYVADERNNMSSTRQRKTSTLRGFFTYLTTHENLLDKNPAEDLATPKRKKTLPKYLSLEQSIALLEAVDGPDKERDYCMLTLFLNCGFRLSELVGINIGDVEFGAQSITVNGKGEKERSVYLNEACLSALADYIKVRPKEGVKDRNALFLSKRKTRISPKTVQYVVNKYLEKIGLADYSVHKLRHTAATLMYQYGNVDIKVLQEILGHENLGTTQIYTHTSSKQRESAIQSNPLANIGHSKTGGQTPDE